MNALAGLMDPAAIGQSVQAGFEHGMQRRKEQQTEDALKAYATNPNGDTARGVAQYDPRLGIQLSNVEAQRQQAAQQAEAQAQAQHQQQMGTFRKLLTHAAQSPEGWQQALGAAQSMGLDTSHIPQQYDPAWAQQQLFITDALEKPEGQQALSTAGKIAADMGYAPGTPEHAKVTREIFLAEQSKPYTDSTGATRLYQPQIGGPGQTHGGPPPEPAIAELRANPASAAQFDEIFGQGASARILGQGGPTQPAPGRFPAIQ